MRSTLNVRTVTVHWVTGRLDVRVGLALPFTAADKGRMRFSALGDSAMVVECGEGISPHTLQRVRVFANALERAAIPDVTDIVAAFATVTVFYLPTKIAASQELPHRQMLRVLEGIGAGLSPDRFSAVENETKVREIPVCYGDEYGPDLPTVARHTGLSPRQVIEVHSEAEYLVHAIGFSPGFPYMGGLPSALHAPRLSTPRVRVEAGSVGIGGAQTGVYPLATPGGWQLIGRTPVRLFDLRRETPSLLQIGDRVKFRAITSEEFIAAQSADEPASGAPQKPSTSSPQVRVLRAGMLTTVQDLGRIGHRADGVPLSGAADPVAVRVANWLVGNDENAAALEFTLVGPELEFLADAVVALGGAAFDDFPRWQPVRVPAGTRLTFGAAREGCRGYLAIGGGFDVEPVLGSASTFLRAAFGGFAGRALQDGDELPWHAQTRHVVTGWRIDPRVVPPYLPAPTLRVVRGAHAEQFLECLLETEFTVTPRSDRMGLRLQGSSLRRGEIGELVSTAVTPGTIQVPPDGLPILLLSDAQTIGGYPQAAHVITVDLPLIAQLRPGDRLRFREVTLDEAQKLLLAREHALAILHEGLSEKFR
ncbi:MAG: 5-oxoprolinase subunit PxpB [Opitutaceae bacterium]